MSVTAFFRSLAWLWRGAPGRLTALALLLTAAVFAPAPAEAAGNAASTLMMPDVKAKPGSEMLVESDELVYDYDNETVSAVGNVKIYYNGNTLEADKVSYNKSTGRLIATGRVKLTDQTGAQLFANSLDITDNFSDGFIDSLRVDTVDKTHFAAENATRINGERTQFNNGVYTACEPCKDHPEKPPLWQVKAKKIVVDHKTHMMYFHSARLEMGGIPLAYTPYFSAPDPTVKRKTGFLAPLFYYSKPLGFGVGMPFFWNLAPNYDLTLTPTYFSQQGFLGDVEWRHRLANGAYSIEAAGIFQQDPHAWLIDNSGTFSQRDFRGGVRTTGDFDINQYWKFGWDGTISTDRTFTRNYMILNNDVSQTISNVHLTGLSDRNYFDARAEYFQILSDTPFVPDNPFAYNNQFEQSRQGIVAPVVDHNYVFDGPVLGGQLSVDSNVTNVIRESNDPFKVGLDPTTYYHGLAGTFTRASTGAEWEKEFILPMGQVFKTFASVRGDAFFIDADHPPPALTTDDTVTRFMPAAGAEWRWPFLVAAGNVSQVFEPIAQIIARPDEPDAGKLFNEDAQSLVFDDTALFDVDKFSGYDRIEGGTRANVGFHYLGTFGSAVSVDALFGQSYQLAGTNSFAVPNISDTGAYSGLESDASDYVARASFDIGPSHFAARGRFDDQDFTINRGELEASTVIGPVTASAAYLYLRQNPEQGLATPVSGVSGSASLQLFEKWRLLGSAAYDLEGSGVLRESAGIAFDNECLSLSIQYSVSSPSADIPTKALMFHILFRTLGEGNINADISSLGQAN